jgi:5'-3' exonuclease
MTRILLAIDLSYQTYRAAAAHPMLTSRRVFTGGLYGFFTTFAKMMRETRATHVAFCQDVKPYLRSLVYPEYKQLRKASADDDLLKMYKQSMSLILEVFEECGLQPWGVPGFESDDLIGHCVMKYRHRFDRIYAGSNDSDIWQLLWADNFFIYTKSINELISGASLAKKHNITPEQFMLATALQGTHNDIAGIVGVGEKTAIKAVRDDPALLRALKAKHGELIERNLGLIKLPHVELPRSTALPQHGGSFNPRQLYKSLGRYDIDVTGSMVNAFEQITRGE